MKIVYDDGAITLCEKPIGVSSEATDESENMPSRLLSYYEEKGERKTPYVLHRLDMAVGGLMVFAKTKSAAAKLSAAISEGKLEKEYLLVVAGDVSKALGEGDGEKANRIFSMLVYSTIVIGACLSVIGIAVARPVARLFAANETGMSAEQKSELIEYCVLYSRTILSVLPDPCGIFDISSKKWKTRFALSESVILSIS